MHNCFYIGTIFKLHGYKGNIKLYNETNIDIEPLANYLYLEINNELIPYFTERITKINSNSFLIKFEDVNSENEANKIIKKKVYIKNEFLIKNKQNSEENLIGYNVINFNKTHLGKVSKVNKRLIQKLIFVKNNNKEFCFPFHKSFIKKTDKEKKILFVEISEQIINLN